MSTKILLIEDDEMIRSLYTDVFTKAGFKIDSAADGQEGLIKARVGGYNLILLDIMMPQLDGLGFLKELKDKPIKTPNGSIILLTNLAHDAVVKEALTAGAKDYIVKADYNPDELVEKIKSYF